MEDRKPEMGLTQQRSRGGDGLKDPPEIATHAPQGRVTLISVDSRSSTGPQWVEMGLPGGSALENSPALQKMQV